MKVLGTKCDCGAITIQNDVDSEHRFSNSMTEETFKKLFDNDEFEIEWMNPTHCCNHCVNKWGLDLCKCGSGDPVGECQWEDCQEHGETMETFLVSAKSGVQAIIDRGGFV